MNEQAPNTACETLSADDLDQIVAGTARRTYEPIVIRKNLSPGIEAGADPAETISS